MDSLPQPIPDEYKTTKIVLRRIPAGSFVMGSPIGELGRDADETEHSVYLSKSYYLGIFEVTQKQWERVMGTWPSHFANLTYRERRPVENISYADVRGDQNGSGWPGADGVDQNSFVGRLRSKALLRFDLPTEAQWEYACRAGTTTALNSGGNLTNDGIDPGMAQLGRYLFNGGGNGDPDDTTVTTASGTTIVGSYFPNEWGLYDMHGNIWEWCRDWYGDYSGSETDPAGAASNWARVLRSGGWNGGADWCRSANRDLENPAAKGFKYGLRLYMPATFEPE